VAVAALDAKRLRHRLHPLHQLRPRDVFREHLQILWRFGRRTRGPLTAAGGCTARGRVRGQHRAGKGEDTKGCETERDTRHDHLSH